MNRSQVDLVNLMLVAVLLRCLDVISKGPEFTTDMSILLASS